MRRAALILLALVAAAALLALFWFRKCQPVASPMPWVPTVVCG